ncbi:MAG: hypothetical protein ACREFN_19740 [Acetobacteraceae bacterium]
MSGVGSRLARRIRCASRSAAQVRTIDEAEWRTLAGLPPASGQD